MSADAARESASISLTTAATPRLVASFFECAYPMSLSSGIVPQSVYDSFAASS